MVDVSPPDHRDRLEASVGVLGESWDRHPVVHAPPVLVGEVGSEIPPHQTGNRSKSVIAFGVMVDVMHREDERIHPTPWETELDELLDCVHYMALNTKTGRTLPSERFLL
jgi:hypothetical protein